ncbi:MAG: N-acetyltransferase [Thermoplasmata archaeon]|jgi:acetyltransferase-like isoleucine patch superfamily enzyme|nr:MAG: N-acetyltransferase [Thermoplasmata archaeon]
MNNKMDFFGKISEKCKIYEDVEIGEGVTICDNVIVYSNVEIGYGSFIGPNCILGEPTHNFYKEKARYKNTKLKIGKNSIIRSHSVIYAGSTIGDNFQTGHRVTIREHSKIGRNCSVGTLSDIQGHVEIGDYCRFHSNVFIGQLSTIKNFVFIFPCVVLTNDPHPPSDTCTKGPTLEEYCVICTGVTILPDITIGKDSLVGAQSLVSRNVEPETVVLGVPASKFCSIYDIRCKKGRLEKPYPWRNHFSRGMPWNKADVKLQNMSRD